MKHLAHNHQHTREEHEKEHSPHGHNGGTGIPYWKRMHRDWRFWTALLLMLAAMAAYLLSGNEALRPNGTLHSAVPAAGG